MKRRTFIAGEAATVAAPKAGLVRFYRCEGLNLTQIAAGHYRVGEFLIRRQLRMWETFDAEGRHLASDFSLAEACIYLAKHYGSRI